MSWIETLNFQSIDFNANVSKRRLEKAKLVFGEYVLKRILCLCFYFMGAKRNKIAQLFDFPKETVCSMFKVIMKDGFEAIKDRRTKKPPDEKVIVQEKVPSVKIAETDSSWQINVNGIDILILKTNLLQFKLILLSFVSNKLISKTEAAILLNISSSQVAHLERELLKNDLPALIDKREGQQKDYKFTPERKSEIIIQFAANAALGKSISSATLSKDIEQRTKLQLSPRSIRYHISKLGLNGKSKLLFNLIGVKKNC